MDTVRKPSIRVVSGDGRVLPAALDMIVRSNDYFDADTFMLTFALNAMNDGINFWTSQKGKPLRIEVAYQGNKPQRDLLITGFIDEVFIRVVKGEVEVHGRDFTSVFIETNLTDLYQNMTATDIVKRIAAKHPEVGFTVEIGTPTTNNTGRYFGSTKKDSGDNKHDEEWGPLTEGGSNVVTTGGPFRRTAFKDEWDFLVALAKAEGRQVWVHDKTLYFLPVDENTVEEVVFGGVQTSPGVAKYLPGSIITDLEISQRDEKINEIKVTVKSWNVARGAAIVETYTRDAANVSNGSGSRGGTGMKELVFTFPNLTQEQAKTKAKNIYDEMKKEQRTVTIKKPGDTKITTRHKIKLVGTNSQCDQEYFVEEIERTLDSLGYHETIRARNEASMLRDDAMEVVSVTRPSQRKRRGDDDAPFGPLGG